MVELIFVIVILGILAAVAIPRLSATRDDAQIAGNLKAIHIAISDFGAYYVSQGTFSSVGKMTNVNKFDNPNANPSDGNVSVKFQTQAQGGLEDCIDFQFSKTGGKLKIVGNSSANGIVCKGILKSPSFKTLNGSYVLGGISVKH